MACIGSRDGAQDHARKILQCPQTLAEGGVWKRDYWLDSFLLTHHHVISTWFVHLAKCGAARMVQSHNHAHSTYSYGYSSSGLTLTS